MNKLLSVAFCILFSGSCFSENLENRLLKIENSWAHVHYTFPEEQQREAFEKLLEQASMLSEQYPERAEPIIIQANIILTVAGIRNPFSALSAIHQARDLLVKSIRLDPDASEGSALVTLGALYYKVPGWPIAFGNDKKAKELLLSALRINPLGIDTNYFYGDFLLTQNKPEAAALYFKKALNAPVNPEKALANHKLQEKAKLALINTIPLNLSAAETGLHTQVKSPR